MTASLFDEIKVPMWFLSTFSIMGGLFGIVYGWMIRPQYWYEPGLVAVLGVIAFMLPANYAAYIRFKRKRPIVSLDQWQT